MLFQLAIGLNGHLSLKRSVSAVREMQCERRNFAPILETYQKESHTGCCAEILFKELGSKNNNKLALKIMESLLQIFVSNTHRVSKSESDTSYILRWL